MENKHSLFGYIFLIILLLGACAMWYLTNLQKDDARNDAAYKQQLIEEYNKIIRFDNDSTNSFVYITREGRPITYQELMDENFNLLKQNDSLNIEIERKERCLELIRDNYDITIVSRNNQLWTEGARVDSALLLLDAYRDRIKYDLAQKTWVVIREESGNSK